MSATAENLELRDTMIHVLDDLNSLRDKRKYILSKTIYAEEDTLNLGETREELYQGLTSLDMAISKLWDVMTSFCRIADKIEHNSMYESKVNTAGTH